jgi:hypothetical protein
MLLSAQQHYPRKGTCTRHGNLRPIIPVTSQGRGDEKPCGMGLGHYSHVIWLLAALRSSALSVTDPALVSTSAVELSISCDGWEASINGVVDEVIHKQLFSWMYRCT